MDWCMGMLDRMAASTGVRERENYAEKGGNPFLQMLREWTLT